MIKGRPQGLDFSGPNRSPSIGIVGVGTSGCKLVQAASKRLVSPTWVIGIDSENDYLDMRNFDNFLRLPKPPGDNSVKQNEVFMARQYAEEERNRIVDMITLLDRIIIVAALGGRIGSGAAPVVAEIGVKQGLSVWGTFVLPFNWEGSSRGKASRCAIRSMEETVDVMNTLPNQALLHRIDRRKPVGEVFGFIENRATKILISQLEVNESLID